MQGGNRIRNWGNKQGICSPSGGDYTPRYPIAILKPIDSKNADIYFLLEGFSFSPQSV